MTQEEKLRAPKTKKQQLSLARNEAGALSEKIAELQLELASKNTEIGDLMDGILDC